MKKKQYKNIITWIVSLATMVAVFYSMLYTGLPKSVGAFGRLDRLVPIYRVECREKKVAISFDAAWGSDITPQLLNILKKHNIKTTFFLVKFWMEKYPDMTRLIAKEGHEIGNHSATHPQMGRIQREKIISEIKETHDKIKELTGQNAKLFRPPFGDYSNILITTANEMGYHVIQWDVELIT